MLCPVGRTSHWDRRCWCTQHPARGFWPAWVQGCSEGSRRVCWEGLDPQGGISDSAPEPFPCTHLPAGCPRGLGSRDHQCELMPAPRGVGPWQSAVLSPGARRPVGDQSQHLTLPLWPQPWSRSLPSRPRGHCHHGCPGLWDLGGGPFTQSPSPGGQSESWPRARWCAAWWGGGLEGA